MGIQDRLEKRFANVSRKLFDKHIRLTGTVVWGVRLRFQTDMYSDEFDNQIVSKDPMVCIVHYPSEIPLHRMRESMPEGTPNPNAPAINESGSSTGVFFYQILPIDLYSQWGDDVMDGDLIVHEIEDEQHNRLTMRLRVAETIGAFRSTLTWKKHMCAPYSGRYNQIYDDVLEQSKEEIGEQQIQASMKSLDEVTEGMYDIR